MADAMYDSDDSDSDDDGRGATLQHQLTFKKDEVYVQPNASSPLDNAVSTNARLAGSTLQTSHCDLHPDDAWSAHIDPNSGSTFYHNQRTGESRWELPAGSQISATAQSLYATNATLSASQASSRTQESSPMQDAPLRIAEPCDRDASQDEEVTSFSVGKRSDIVEQSAPDSVRELASTRFPSLSTSKQWSDTRPTDTRARPPSRDPCLGLSVESAKSVEQGTHGSSCIELSEVDGQQSTTYERFSMQSALEGTPDSTDYVDANSTHLEYVSHLVDSREEDTQGNSARAAETFEDQHHHLHPDLVVDSFERSRLPESRDISRPDLLEMASAARQSISHDTRLPVASGDRSNRVGSQGVATRRRDASVGSGTGLTRSGSRQRLASNDRLSRPTTSSMQHATQQRPAARPVRRREGTSVPRSSSRGTPMTSERSACPKPSIASAVQASSSYECAEEHSRSSQRSHKRTSVVAFSDWSSLPDAVLLQAIVLVGPREVCAAVAVCCAWAETVTSSEAWLWSVVGCVGLAPEIFALLGCWATAAGVAVRHALQLWLCRAHLWNGAMWADARRNPVKTVTWSSLPCDTSPVCCSSWFGDAGDLGVAVGTAGGVLAFGRLEIDSEPTRGLQGKTITGFERSASVRAAHGNQLITAIRPIFPEGKSVVSCGLDGLLRIWDTASAEETTQIVTPLDRGINSISLSPNTISLCSGDDGFALLYDLGAPLHVGTQPIRRFQGHGACVYSSAWTSESTCATGGFDRRTLLWDCRVPTHPVQTLPARQHVYALAPFASNGARGSDACKGIAVGLADGTISYWDLRHIGKEPMKELRGHTGAVEALAVLPGNILASTSADSTLRLWDRAGEAAWQWTGRGPITGITTVFEDSLLVVGMSLSPTLLTLDYVEAAHCVPEVQERLHLPTLKAWKRGPGEIVPPEGIGRHSDLLSQRRIRRGSSRVGVEEPMFTPTVPRGAFDRSTKTKPTPLGSTGAAHRAFLFGIRR